MLLLSFFCFVLFLFFLFFVFVFSEKPFRDENKVVCMYVITVGYYTYLKT